MPSTKALCVLPLLIGLVLLGSCGDGTPVEPGLRVTSLTSTSSALHCSDSANVDEASLTRWRTKDSGGNIVFRWVPNGDLPKIFEALCEVKLAVGGASTITDIVACPGTDTCKLGISSSRG